MSGRDCVSLGIANCGFDWSLADPAELLDRYHALVGWAEAVARAGRGSVTVVQRFRRDAVVERNGVVYRFVAEGPPGPTNRWFRGDRMARAIVAAAPDTVHVNGCTFPMLVRTLRRRLPERVAITVQDHGGSGIQNLSRGVRGLAWSRIQRFGLRAADSFFFTSREQAAPWSRAGIIGRDQVVYEIPEASTDLGRSLAEAAPGRRLPGEPALLSVARLDPNKDPLTLLAGFERAAPALPKAALTLVFGDDVMLPEVRARIASSTVLASRVHLRGPVKRSELSEIYRGADLFLLGSHREVASFALIEALSFGVIPIVSDIAPFRALTNDGRLGALFPPGDAEALGRAIERLGRGDMTGRREAVQAHFASHLSWSVVGARALAAYVETTEKRRRLHRAS
jgi:glycosyltransferase involved in cell wall biosynthesis